MGLDSRQLQMLHEHLGGGAAALQLKGHHTAGTVGQILFGYLMIGVSGQAAVVDNLHLGVGGQELGHGLSVLAVAGHADVEAF